MRHFLPLDFVAQVITGSTVGGIVAIVSSPAFAPVWAAVAAGVVALCQVIYRRMTGQTLSPDAKAHIEAATSAFAASLVKSHTDTKYECKDGAKPAEAANQPKLPGVTMALMGILALATVAGCAGTPLPFGGVSRGAHIYMSPEWGKCAVVSADYMGGYTDGGISLSAHTCVGVSSNFGAIGMDNPTPEVDAAVPQGPVMTPSILRPLLH